MAPVTMLLRVLLVLPVLYLLSDLLRKRLAFALLTSMEMPQAVLQGALRVLVVVQVMPKPQEVQRLM